MSESTLNALTLPDAAKQTVAAEKAVCFLCGSPMEVTLSGVTDNRLGTPGTYEIHGCPACGLEQIYPLPSLADLKVLYETHYNFGG